MKSLLLIAIMLSTVSCGFEIVDTGYRGVKTKFGKVVEAPLGEGLHFYNPLTTDIRELSVREVKQDGKTMAYTKDVQNADIRFSVSYALMPIAVGPTYTEAGYNWEEKFVPQRVKGSIKAIAGKYEATDLVQRREEARIRIYEILKGKLAEKSIILRGLEITNIDYNDKFEKAVEAKVIATQRAQESKNKTVRIREEKAQAILKAEGVAQAMEIKAKALSKNKDLIELEAVKKWNGVLPQQMFSTGSIPFLKTIK